MAERDQTGAKPRPARKPPVASPARHGIASVAHHFLTAPAARGTKASTRPVRAVERGVPRRVVVLGGDSAAARSLAALLVRDDLVQANGGLLNRSLAAQLLAWRERTRTRWAAEPALEGLVWCWPVGAASPRMAVHLLGRVVHALAPRWVAALLLRGDASVAREGRRSPSGSAAASWLSGLCSAACGRPVAILEVPPGLGISTSESVRLIGQWLARSGAAAQSPPHAGAGRSDCGAVLPLRESLSRCGPTG